MPNVGYVTRACWGGPNDGSVIVLPYYADGYIPQGHESSGYGYVLRGDRYEWRKQEERAA